MHKNLMVKAQSNAQKSNILSIKISIQQINSKNLFLLLKMCHVYIMFVQYHFSF